MFKVCLTLNRNKLILKCATYLELELIRTWDIERFNIRKKIEQNSTLQFNLSSARDNMVISEH